jgi:hypothetical protein
VSLGLTVGEAISAALRAVNLGSSAVAYDADLRSQARLYLTQQAQRVHTYGPHWFKHADGQVVLGIGEVNGTLPGDFSNFGFQAKVFLDGGRRELTWLDPDQMHAVRQANPTLQQDPTHYTLMRSTTGVGGGVPQLDVWPAPGRAVTIDVENYVVRVHELIDCPLSPGVAVNAATGNVIGPVTYRLTFVHPGGETEGGFVSASVNPASQKVDLTKLAVSPSRAVTDRNLYRTAAGGAQYLLVQAIGDNVATTFTDDLLDADLGVPLPGPDQAVTGLERFPWDWHETVFVDGLIQQMRAAVKQVPFTLFSPEWERNIKRLWADQRNDRHIARIMPAYGVGARNMAIGRRWRQLP